MKYAVQLTMLALQMILHTQFRCKEYQLLSTIGDYFVHECVMNSVLISIALFKRVLSYFNYI